MTEVIPLPSVDDLHFVSDHPYTARHACGVVIFGRGGDLHEQMREHTASCATEGNPR